MGAIILMASAIITKVVGAIFKIPLTNLIGADGIGMFSVAYTVYSTLFVISTAGLPAAISKMVAEAEAAGNSGRSKKILRTALSTFSLIGIAASLITFVFARQLTELVGNSMAYYSILAVAPSLFFVSVISIIRGYFQGLSNMMPTAVSQILEALGKLVFGLLFAKVAIDRGMSTEFAAAGAMLGVTAGTVIAAVFLLIRCKVYTQNIRKIKPQGSFGETFRDIVGTAVPVTVGAAVLSLTNLIDMFMVMNRLQWPGGFSEAMANKLYGAYTMSVSIYNLPQTIIVAISVSVIPVIAACMARNNLQKARSTIESALRITSMIAMPAGIGFFVLSENILNLLYYKKPEDVVYAVPLLRFLGFAVIFVALVSLTNSILQSINRIKVPVVTMFIGGVIKIIANFFLVAMPALNIKGAPIGTVCCYGTIAILNLMVIKANVEKLSIFGIFFKPFFASAAMGAFAYFTVNPITAYRGDKIGIVAVIALAAVFYFAVLFAVGGVKKQDVLLMPKGEKIAKLLNLK